MSSSLRRALTAVVAVTIAASAAPVSAWAATSAVATAPTRAPWMVDEVVPGTPSVMGSPVVGETLHVDPGTWGDAVLTYAWFADGVAVPGATLDTLLITPDLAGRRLRVDVTGTLEGADPATAQSTETLRVLAPGSVSMAGEARVGSTLTATPSAWPEGTTFAFRWLDGGAPIAGASTSAWTPDASRVGHLVSVEVSASHSEYPPFVATSPPLQVGTGTLMSAIPVITGTLSVGSTLSASPGSWTPGTAFAYEWRVGGVAVSGATGKTFTLRSVDAGKSVAVSVRGSLDGFQPVSRVSAASLRVLVAATPVISGTRAVGSTLTAGAGTWTTGTTFSYAWFAGGVAVPGATGRTFVLTTAQADKTMTVRVTGSLSGFASVARQSGGTARIMRWSTPTIAGTLAQGHTVSARPNAWSSGTSFAYLWYADGVAIAGATASTLTLTSAHTGKRISVRTTGSQSGYQALAKTSAQSSRVTVASTPTILGTRAYGSTLTAKPGTWLAYTAFQYQWYADGVAISGATSSAFKLTSAQISRQLTVRVTGTRPGYATVAKTSGATARIALAPTPTISGTRLVTYTLYAGSGTWTSGTTLSYRWYVNGVATSSASSSFKLSTAHYGKTITVRVTGVKSGYQTITRTSAATTAIGYPSRTVPISTYNCPSWAPIKGNADSMIYHVPGGQYYNVTIPEECFRTETAAVAAGYRKSLR